ncbi:MULTISPECIES: NADH:flavin oxidoreductase/NADH oxidase [Niallia]|uniref:NADH:flavin oxidoreductase/NADH oxidase n=1 Tax=Niallia TaxID=2837506 RepID=UPI001EDA4D32|nr:MULTISPECIES: NADH:flavin oxidoreductase/NADH oxidase [Niallia]MED4040119.1 NADH:flavin oxidoreductase/NADH oxidase [Niallia taxi]UPO91125.1 NADH:flavin oxidoreductase/NADH oxidase [Niallia sp. Man26]
MANLDTPFSIKGLTLKNKIIMPPMCQYSVEAEDGIPNDWHYVHYVSRAVGGTGLIIMEMTDIEPEGRITNKDLGLWTDEQIPAFARIISDVQKYGSKIGVQIAHAGRKAEDALYPVGASNILAPSEHGVSYNSPRALTTSEVKDMVTKFKESVRRAVTAGFDVIELHGAHGYLIHQFHSPSINNRTDEYGKDLSLFGVEVIKAARSVMPKDMPLIMRISAVEYMDGGYDLEHSLTIAKSYKEAGVDIFDVSSGGDGPPGKVKPANHYGYQVPFARAFRETLKAPVIAVGKLDNPHMVEATLANGDADLVAVGRGMLDDPYWALHAIRTVTRQVNPPAQYVRGIYVR